MARHDRSVQGLRRLLTPLSALLLAASIATCAVVDRGASINAPVDTPVDDTPPLVLISIDGFRHDYLDRVELPALERLARNGLQADGLVHIFPTKTFATHYALATGLFAENSGVVANRMWDPERESTFSLGNRDAVGDGFWYDGEPIWNTVEKAGRIASPNTWPGGAAQIGGRRPTIVRLYDGSVPHDERVDTVLEWLDLPPDERPLFSTLYFSVVDSTGHDHGPDAPQVVDAMIEVDRAIGRLIEGLEQRGMLDEVHLLVTSDHGMEPIDAERYVLLDDHFPMDRVRASDWGPAAQLWTMEGGPSADEIVAALADVPQVTAWKKGEAPERYRFDDHKRVPDVTVEADLGWMISNRDYYRTLLEEGGPGGMHGWDPTWHSMHGIFIAHGPEFVAGSRLPAVRSVDLYSLMAALMNVPPAETDGDLRAFRPVLSAEAPTEVDVALWDCRDRRFVVRSSPGVASLDAGRRVFALPRQVSASGVRYGEPGVEYLSKGDLARFEIDGEVWTDCARIVR